VLRRLRARDGALPVLMLTADASVEGRISGLDGGADDYLVKPFEVGELEARIRALMRRAGGQRKPLVHCGRLTYDSNTRRFEVGGQPLKLTPREHALLEALLHRIGRTVSKQELAESLFSLDDDAGLESIEVYVHRLRRKLEGSDAVIATLRGLGYLLQPAQDE